MISTTKFICSSSRMVIALENWRRMRSFWINNFNQMAQNFRYLPTTTKLFKTLCLVIS